jgi:peptide/nickel transport system permease protein
VIRETQAGIVWSAPAPRSLLRQPTAVASLAWLVMVIALAVLAPVLAPAGPLAAEPTHRLQPPAASAWLGTDQLGRDVFGRLLWGGRWTLQIGLAGVALSVALGLPVGLLAGLVAGWVDLVLMRVVDALLAFPNLLLAMTLIALTGPGLLAVSLAVGLAAAPGYARIARSAVLEVRTEPYVEAARAIGATEWRVLTRHILPNAAGPLLAFAATQLGWVLLNGAALTFLGLGAPPGVPEWGAMLADARGYLRGAPWASLFPGLAIMLTVLAANLLGDGVLETLRPHS